MNYIFSQPEKIWDLSIEHLRLAMLPLLIALLVAFPLSLLAYRSPLLRRIAVIVGSVMFTIPSLALFVILPSIIGTRILSETNVIVALALYATALLVRAIPEALDSAPADVMDASKAIGYGPLALLTKVQLPLSLPALIPLLRVISVTNISMVSVGSVIGFGGLGLLFTEGYSRNYQSEIWAGIIMIVVLALVIDLIFVLIGRLATPWRRAGNAHETPKAVVAR